VDAGLPELATDLAWQPSLFADDRPGLDLDYRGLRRIALDERSWVDYCPGWLAGADAVFADLVSTAPWQQRVSTVYDRTGPEPRLTAGWDMDTGIDAAAGTTEGGPPAILGELARALTDRYGVDFDRIWCNLYRDGRDSVAWHRDRNGKVMTNPIVATVSLGAHRPFQLRRRGTSKIAASIEPGDGDLVVMCGACQHDWEHTVPKVARRVGPRISITIRHSEPAPGEARIGDPKRVLPGQAW
jgi:alkylated DNA repair dioxygenase AlkB